MWASGSAVSWLGNGFQREALAFLYDRKGGRSRQNKEKNKSLSLEKSGKNRGEEMK